MGVNPPSTFEKEAEARTASAVFMAKSIVGDGYYYVPERAPIGRLTLMEWSKIVNAAVSGWITERSKQLTAERAMDERTFLATGVEPEPFELGICAVALPGLADFIEQRGLTDKPIGEWSKPDVILFVWTVAEIVERARVASAERPGPAEINAPDAPDIIMAG